MRARKSPKGRSKKRHPYYPTRIVACYRCRAGRLIRNEDDTYPKTCPACGQTLYRVYKREKVDALLKAPSWLIRQGVGALHIASGTLESELVAILDRYAESAS